MTIRHWHSAQWVEGERRVSALTVPEEGEHGELVERWGAYAYPIDVPDDPRRWVCHWACTAADVR